MKYAYTLIIAVIVTILIVIQGQAKISSQPLLIENQNNSNPNINTELLYFGYSTYDLYPVSYTGVGQENNNLKGYCGGLLNHLRRNNDFILAKTSLKNRFTGYSDQDEKLALFCGANTITFERKELLRNIKNNPGEFSNPFLSTGAKLLIKKENVSKFYSQNPLNIEKIGALYYTTTIEAIRTIFPSSKENIEGFHLRSKALEDLKNDKIIAFASDELFLKRLLEKFEENDLKNPNDYTIVPNQRLTNENIAVVIYNQNLKDTINDWIRSDEGKEEQKKLEKILYGNLIDKIFRYLDQENSWFGYLQNSIVFLIICFITLLIIFTRFIWKNCNKLIMNLNRLFVKKNKKLEKETLVNIDDKPKKEPSVNTDVKPEKEPPVTINIHNHNDNQHHSGEGDNVGKNKDTNNYK